MLPNTHAQQMLDAKTRANLSKLNTLTHPHLLKIARHIFLDEPEVAKNLITKLEHEDSALVTGFTALLNAAITDYEKAEKLNYLRDEAIQFTVFKYYLKFIVLFAKTIANQLADDNKVALVSLEMDITLSEASYKLTAMNYVLGFPLLHALANTHFQKATLDTKRWFMGPRNLTIHHILKDFLAYYPQDTIKKIQESGLSGLQAVADDNERLKRTNEQLSKQVGDLRTQLEDANARVLRLERENAELRGITHQPTATPAAASSAPAAGTMTGAKIDGAPTAAQLSASLAPVLVPGSSRATPSKPVVSNELKLGGYITEKQQFVLEKLIERYNALIAQSKTAEDPEVKAIIGLFIQLLNCAMLAHLKRDGFTQKLSPAIQTSLGAFEASNRTDAILSLWKDRYDFIDNLLNTSGFDLLNDEVINNTKPIAGKNNLAHRFTSPLQFKLGVNPDALAALPIFNLFNSWAIDAIENGKTVEDLINNLASVPLPQSHTAPKTTM